ncbi:DUF3291 domain-containing protein [Streptomyces sp. PSKA54]|uniref:DUF3291 domain-containing protein n=1 Tax=Streptomyces himalayensis subsp. aureolus TaxID=2758039 RepID=A0A7W2HF63_9ACTN|nr:DUF3291 domain-containing protein [Streptomyces himalayensis]MBA4861359.1 DUF3291 domain-containing protein [Streptomyces himalayensis subsp. aureolus]
MPTLPWSVPNTPPRHAEAHVMASRFETRTLWGALRFFIRTPAVWHQVSRAPGAYGASLKASPLRRTFWTLSAWESPEALRRFARSGPHGPAVRGLRPLMHDAKFVTWSATTDELPLDWADALKRLE